MKRLLLKIIDTIMMTLAALIVLLGVLFSLVRLFLPHLPVYQNRIQQWASAAIHQPVRIGQMTSLWSGLSPEVKFQNVEVLSKDQSQVLLKVDELGVGIDILKSLLRWRIEPGWLDVSGAKLTVQQDPTTGHLIFNGMVASTSANNASFKMQDFVDWLISQNKIYLEHIDLTWQNRQGQVIPIHNINLKFAQGLLHNQLIGSAVIHMVPYSATPIRFVLNFKGNPLDSSSDFKATLYLRTRHVPLGFWLAKRLPQVTVSQGTLDLQLWATWKERQLQSLHSRFISHETAVASSYLLRNVFLNRATGDLLWQRQSQGWQLQGKTRLTVDEEAFPEMKFSLQRAVTTTNSALQQYHLQLNTADIGLLQKYLLNTTVISAAQRNRLKQLQPVGILQDIHLVVSKTPTEKWALPADFTLAAQFDDVGWKHWQHLPGVTHLSGMLQITPQSGAITLNTENAVWDFGDLFRYPLPTDQLSGEITWRKKDLGWQIKGAHIAAQNKQADIHGDFSLLLPNNQSSPVIDLLAGFNVPQLAPALRYLPVAVMSPGLVHWLDEAIITGNASGGKLVLSGPLRAFPFWKQEGRFIVNSDIHDLTLHYDENWPNIQNLKGEVTFDNGGMQLQASSGKIFNATIHEATAAIPNFHTPVLQVKAAATGTLQDGLQFITQSPLNRSIGKGLEGFIMQGPMTLGLQLTVPIKQGKIQVLGNVTTKNADVKIPYLYNLQAQAVQGNLQFTEDSLTGKLTGTFMQQPLNIAVTTLKSANKPNIIQFDFGKGHMTVRQAQQQFDLPKINEVTGSFNYHVLLQLMTGAKSLNKLLINSDLTGVAVNLPAPLGKQAAEKTLSTLQLNFNSAATLQWLFNYGKRLSAALTYHKNPQGNYTLSGGEITLGGKQANFTSQTGLTIDGHLANFDWSIWQPVLAGMSQTATTATRPPAWLKSINLNFDQLKMFNWSLTQTTLQLQPGPQAWQVAINSPNIAGKLIVPYIFPRGVLNAELDRLYLPENKGKSKINLTPNQIPKLNLHCSDFQYGNKKIGTITLQVTPSGNSLRIDKLIAESDNVYFNATGAWQASPNNTQLTGRLRTPDLGSILREWDLTQSLVGAGGNVDFNLTWAGPPFQPTLASLSGQVALKFHEGRIINLGQSTEAELGIGRVLNLFSLQTLPRRLRLDFSDLTTAGFSFDIMQADFTLQQGNANTTDAYLDGPIAKVAFKGRIGLSAKDYDLRLSTTPYVTSNIPVVAGVAAGLAGGPLGIPIAGAVSWVANKMLSSTVSQLTTYTYHVTGSWDDPNIEKL